MVVIDFNLPINFGQNTFAKTLKGQANARGTNCFLTTGRLFTKTPLPQMRWQISRQLPNKNIFLFRSIPLHGVRSDNISTESSRYRNLLTSNAVQVIPLRYPRKSFPQHFGQGKRKSKLSNLRRLRPCVDKQSPEALCQRRIRCSTKTGCLCTRFNNHRFMSVTVSMGKISQTQSRSQGAHANGPERLYALFYPHYRRKSTRCKYPRRAGFRAGRILHNGSCLPRLRSSLYIHSKPFIFCYKSKKQFRLPSSLLSQGRQNYRFAMRPNDKTQRLLCFAGLSCCSSSNKLLRYQDKEKIRIFNEQLFSASFDNCPTLQMPLADRNLFQMDQAMPAYQNIFWHYRERSEDSNLDCHQRLRSGSDYQERTQNQAEFGQNLANSQHCTFRESSYYTSTYEKYVAKRKLSVS
jgi:hypothetical protein